MKRLIFFIYLFFYFTQILVAQTQLEKGDIVVLGSNFRNNNNDCTTAANNYYDNIYLISFKQIDHGTIIDITDNGYYRTSNNSFGTAEGVLRLKRTGASISAGVIFSININGNSLNSSTTKIGNQNDINGWDVSNLNNSLSNSSTFALSGSGDQFFIMQGGSWLNTYINEGNYNGNFLFAYNSRKQWLSNRNSPNHSGFLDELNCFHITNVNANNTTYRNYGYFKGTFNGNLSQGEWLIRFLNNSNWTNATSCINFNNNVPHSTISIKNTVEQQLCFGEVISPLIVIQESNILNYEWLRSSDAIKGNTDDILVANGTNFYQFNPPNIEGDFYYYCKFSVNGYDNSACFFTSNLYRIIIKPLPKISPIEMN